MERGDATPNLEYTVILPSRTRKVDRPQGSIRPGTLVLPSPYNFKAPPRPAHQTHSNAATYSPRRGAGSGGPIVI